MRTFWLGQSVNDTFLGKKGIIVKRTISSVTVRIPEFGDVDYLIPGKTSISKGDCSTTEDLEVAPSTQLAASLLMNLYDKGVKFTLDKDSILIHTEEEKIFPFDSTSSMCRALEKALA